MSQNPDDKRHILHLSDIHLEKLGDAQNYLNRLTLDLTTNLKVKKIDYLVVSGDLTNKAAPEEYLAVFDMLNELKLEYDIANDRVIIAPGNHDLSWAEAMRSYKPVAKRQVPKVLGDDYIPWPEGKTSRLEDEEAYRKRFDTFAAFYRKVCGGKPYLSTYEDQAVVHAFPADRILFLTLNSAWQIDHYWKKRASINMDALGKALREVSRGTYDGWLKVAVWHHPVAGPEAMNTEFLEQLAVAGFEVALHGHIHEAISNYYTYDPKRGLRIIGGGTFGAPTHEQVTSIPLQYNLIEFEPRKAAMTVRSRKKEKVNGAWSADARWGSKESPVAFHKFALKKYVAAGPPTDGKPSQTGGRKTPPLPPGVVNIVGTRWKAEWLFDDGKVYVSDKVTFERWTGQGQFEGYGEATFGDTEYKYPFSGEVSFGTRIVVLTYRAENYPEEGNIGVACMEFSNSARELTGYWAGRAHRVENGTKSYTVRTGKIEMKKIKDLNK